MSLYQMDFPIIEKRIKLETINIITHELINEM